MPQRNRPANNSRSRTGKASTGSARPSTNKTVAENHKKSQIDQLLEEEDHHLSQNQRENISRIDKVSERRFIQIKDVVVTVDDLRQLGDVIKRLVKESNPSKYAHLAVTLTDSRDADFSSSSLDILHQAEIIERRSIVSVDIAFNDFGSDERPNIDLNLQTGSYSGRYTNSLTVSGNNRIWVNAAVRQIEDCIDSWEKQQSWFRRNQWLSRLLFAVSLSLPICYWFANYIFNSSFRPPQRLPSLVDVPIYVSVIIFVMATLICLLLTINVIDKIVDLWPQVELQTGKEHFQSYRRKRNAAGLIVTLILIPLVVTVIYDIVKYFI